MKRLLRKPFERLASLIGIPAIRRRIDKQRDRIDLIEEAIQGLSSNLRTNVREIYANIQMKSDIRDGQIADIRRGIDRLRISGGTRQVESHSTSPGNSVNPTIDPSLYVALEDAFRGDADFVRQRQMAYLPYIQSAVTNNHQLVDLGCGRGEWLLLLQERNLPAYGVDSNEAALADCSELGLSAWKSDLIEHLKSLPDASLGAVTMFQVLEHLPFNAVVEVLREARRVLRDGGVFIGEVPNGESLRVGASTFWIDPTHERPMFPGVLRFLASEVGFSKVGGVYSSPLAPEPNLEGLPEGAAQAIRQLHQLVNGPGDFAIIATA